MNPIDRAFFREAEDGTWIFFPWGFTHRGYRLAGERDKKRATRAAAFLMQSVIAIGVVTAYLLEAALDAGASRPSDFARELALPGLALAAVIAGYAAWVTRLVERWPESDRVVSREERLREAAAVSEPRKVILAGLLVCAMSALVIWLEPAVWWLGALGVAVGVGLAWWGALLRRAGSAPELDDRAAPPIG